MPRESIFTLTDSGKPEITGNGNIGENGKPASPDSGTINPASIVSGDASTSGPDSGGNSGDGSRPKRKYRKRNSSAQSGETLSVEACAGILISCHAMLARMSQNPIWEIEKDEADRFAKATVDLSAHYGFSPSSKSVAWTNFVMAAGEVYGTRFYVMMNERANRKRKPAQSQTPQQAEEMPNIINWPNDAQHNV